MNEARPKDKPKSLLSWVSHPARREPSKAALAVLVAIAMGVTVAGWAGIWFGIFSFLVLLGSVQGFLLPSRYRISEENLTVQTLFGKQQRPWSALRRADAGRHGVHLSPFSSRTWLDATRGIYVRYENNRDDVLEAVTERIASAHRRSTAVIDNRRGDEYEGSHRQTQRSAVEGDAG